MAVGPKEYWSVSLHKSGVWGLDDLPRYITCYNLVSLGDVLLFYVTKPISGIIGFGTVQSKERENKPL
jgi:hypothetical protein